MSAMAQHEMRKNEEGNAYCKWCAEAEADCKGPCADHPEYPLLLHRNKRVECVNLAWEFLPISAPNAQAERLAAHIHDAVKQWLATQTV